MFKSRLIFFGALALLAAMGTPLRAQGTTQVQLAFGYECGDRFIVRNEGTQPVLLEYAAARSQDRSQLHLNGNQFVVYAQPDSYYPYAYGGFYPYSYYPSVGFYGFGGYGFGGYARGGFGHGGVGRVGGGGRTGGRGRGHR